MIVHAYEIKVNKSNILTKDVSAKAYEMIIPFLNHSKNQKHNRERKEKEENELNYSIPMTTFTKVKAHQVITSSTCYYILELKKLMFC